MSIFRANKYKNQGFTLLETMIYFTLLSIILLVVVDLFFRISESSLDSSTKNALETEGAYVLNRIAYDIHRLDLNNGDILWAPLNPGDSTPYLIAKINTKNYIYLKNPNDGEIIFGEFFIVIDRLTSNSVQLDNPMSFTHISNPGGKPTIKVEFTLKSTTQSKDGTFESRDFESVFSIR